MLLIVVIALYVIGLVLTGWGLFNAVIATQRDLIRAKDRIPLLERLQARQSAEERLLQNQEEAERKELIEQRNGQVSKEDWANLAAKWTPRYDELHARHDEEYAEHGFVRATIEKLPQLAQYESQWLLQRILDSNRWNLVLLGSGLVVTTVASIFSLFV